MSQNHRKLDYSPFKPKLLNPKCKQALQAEKEALRLPHTEAVQGNFPGKVQGYLAHKVHPHPRT